MTNSTLNLTPELYHYLLTTSSRESELLAELRDVTAKNEKASMQIAPEQGQFMQLLVKLTGAKNILEIGTFTGYSALVMAQALPEQGKIICCDVSEEWTNIAEGFWKRAGVDQKISLKLAPATNTLNDLLNEGLAETFDMAFVDADKENYDQYYELCLQLLCSGGLLLIDNTLWGGSVIDDSKQDVDTNAIRALNIKLQQDERIEISHLPIGDGLTLALKR